MHRGRCRKMLMIRGRCSKVRTRKYALVTMKPQTLRMKSNATGTCFTEKFDEWPSMAAAAANWADEGKRARIYILYVDGVYLAVQCAQTVGAMQIWGCQMMPIHVWDTRQWKAKVITLVTMGCQMLWTGRKQPARVLSQFLKEDFPLPLPIENWTQRFMVTYPWCGWRTLGCLVYSVGVCDEEMIRNDDDNTWKKHDSENQWICLFWRWSFRCCEWNRKQPTRVVSKS